MHKKQQELNNYLASLDSIAVAFSGGVDSAYLLKAAHDILGDRTVAVTARFCLFPARETDEAAEFCRIYGIRHIIFDLNEGEIDGFAENPPERCYFCKTAVLKKIREIAEENTIKHVAEGTNKDDDGDYRPGLQAIEELGIKSPLRHVGLSKAEIRALSKEKGLSTWDKLSYSCLATRIQYGERITSDKLGMIDAAEQELSALGLQQVRVRYHNGALARIETDEHGFNLLSVRETRSALYKRFREIGFAYIALDLIGYRTGSMNEILTNTNQQKKPPDFH